MLGNFEGEFFSDSQINTVIYTVSYKFTCFTGSYGCHREYSRGDNSDAAGS